MTIKNYDQAKTLIDVGMEKEYRTPDEINDFLPQNISSPEDVEDIFDLLSESNIDVVDTTKETIGAPGERQREWEEAEGFSAEKTDNIIWVYLKHMGKVSLSPQKRNMRLPNGSRSEKARSEVCFLGCLKA